MEIRAPYEEVSTNASPLAPTRPSSNTYSWLWTVWSNGEHLGLGDMASGLVSGDTTSSLPRTRPSPGTKSVMLSPVVVCPAPPSFQICLPPCQVCSHPHLHPCPPEARLRLSLNALWAPDRASLTMRFRRHTRIHMRRHCVCTHILFPEASGDGCSATWAYRAGKASLYH